MSETSTLGSELIKEERVRQIEKENYSDEHDNKYTEGELALGAMAYLTAYGAGTYTNVPAEFVREAALRFWNWDDTEFKISKDPIRNLTKAGALIAAEIDRLQRTEQKYEA